MEKKDKDIALFVAFCIEEYGAAKGMTGDQVLNLFSQYGGWRKMAEESADDVGNIVGRSYIK